MSHDARLFRRLLLPAAAVFSGLMLLASGCVWGIVKDADTGEALSGATVTYTDANGNSASTTTGESGLYAFDIASGPIPAVGTVTFEVSKSGYQTLTTNRAVQYNDNPNASLSNLSSFWEVQSFNLSVEGADISSVASGLSFPVGAVYDDDGSLYFSERGVCRVRKVSGGGITTVAGSGVCGFSGDGGAATSAQLKGPTGLALDPEGDLVIMDSDNCRVRKVDLDTGTISTVAGNGTCSFAGDGGAATAASLSTSSASVAGSPYVWSDIAFDASGNMYIGDLFNCRVRKVDTSGNISTFAGSGANGFGCGAFAGDGGPATSARLGHAVGVALSPRGDVYIADLDNCRVRKVSRGSGTITTIAGNGTCAFGGDGGEPTDASLANPRGIAVDAEGTIFVSEFGFGGSPMHTLNCRVREIDLETDIISTLAGTGTCGFSGDGADAVSAEIATPADIALSCSGDLVFAEPDNGRLRAVEDVSSGGPSPDSDSDGVGYVCD